MGIRWVGVVVSFTIATTAGATPVVTGRSNDERCVEARDMALAEFRSNSPSLLWPVASTIRRDTKIILTQASQDISGGAGVDAGPEFDRIGGVDHEPIVFWRSHQPNGPHLVIVDTPFNWRGDWYAVYILPPNATADELMKRLEGKGSGKTPDPLLGDNRWAVPLVLTDRKTNRDWIIDRGEPYQTLSDWQLYEPDGLALKRLCTVSFGVPKAGGLSLLPLAVKRFAAAADEALGPGAHEGTLHPTATIRLKVEMDWTNAALRPWALTEMPFNTRAEIDRGLSEWAEGNRNRLALRARIRRNETIAEAQLTEYYISHFGRSTVSARNLSRHVMDHVLRDYFTFSKSD